MVEDNGSIGLSVNRWPCIFSQIFSDSFDLLCDMHLKSVGRSVEMYY